MSISRFNEIDNKIIDILKEKGPLSTKEIEELAGEEHYKINGRIKSLKDGGVIWSVGEVMRNRSMVKVWGLKSFGEL